MRAPSPPLRVAIAGLGGYAAVHHDTVLRLERLGELRLIATCDPDAPAHATRAATWDFPGRKVPVYPAFTDMLGHHAAELDFVLLPVPIPLHRDFHAAAVAAGVPVYLEKPPTLDPEELEAMIRTDESARFATQVGFNFIAEPTRLALKNRLVAGEFGPLQEARLSARWSRPRSYFTRAPWAGRLLDGDGRYVLDSCCGNALAHFVHNLLFWAGPDLHSWAAPTTLRASLHRAHAIEGADTFFIAAETAQDIPLRLALTHACDGPLHHAEILLCADATLIYVTGSHYDLHWQDGRVEHHILPPFDSLAENIRHYARYLRGENPRPATTLAESRPFVRIHALSYVASRQIHPFPAESIQAHTDRATGQTRLHVAGLEEACEDFLNQGLWPGPHHGAPAEAAPAVPPADLDRLRPVIEAMSDLVTA